MPLPKYPTPTDTLEGYTYTGDNYGTMEIWKKDTQRALVDVLYGERKIHLLYDTKIDGQTK